ncbi:MAG TPA: site-2 protease family protein [Candidatus Dormibacteraeota bacterium]|jgi:Zn-dependent protease|nr:site-2 protease family protein [Candidatus Dormibacteraeota bacterium]
MTTPGEGGYQPPAGGPDYLHLPPQPDYGKLAGGQPDHGPDIPAGVGDPGYSPWAAPASQHHEAGRVDVPLEHMGRNRGFSGGILAIGLALLKGGALVAKAPFLLGIFVNIALYAVLFGSRFGLVYGIAFAFGFVALIFVHEMGHVFAAQLEGVPVTAPLFIPFMGAAIFLKQNPRDARSEAIIAIGGPIAGTLASFAVYGVGNSFGPDTPTGTFFIVLAGYGFFINLFNMIPARPLDGGRIIGAVSKWFNLAGLLVLLAVNVATLPDFSFILVIITAFVAWSTYQRFVQPPPPAYFAISAASKATIGIAYLALLGTLVFAYSQVEPYLTTLRF